PQGDAVDLPLDLRDHQARGLGRAGGGGNDVQRRRAGAPQVFVGEVEDLLVVGVAVHRHHVAVAEAPVVQDDLHHGYETVRRAGGVGNDVMLRGVVLPVVHSHHDRDVLALGGRGDHHLLGAGGEVLGGGVAVGESACALQHELD